MIIEFNDNALKELYLYGSTTDRVIKNYQKKLLNNILKQLTTSNQFNE